MGVYKSYCAVHQPIRKPALESLRRAAVQHVELLNGDQGWGEEDIHAVLGALPDTVDSVRVWTEPFRAALSLRQDHRGQVGGLGSRGARLDCSRLCRRAQGSMQGLRSPVSGKG